MAKLDFATNPFKVFTPEGMDAEDAHDLFVPVPDFNKIRDVGHTMLNGPRGCGKSMLFRCLLPDCQMLEHKATLEQLPFFSALVSIKNTAPNLTEFHRLEDAHAKIILNEHVLTVFVTSKVFGCLAKTLATTRSDWSEAAIAFFEDSLVKRLRQFGWKGKERIQDRISAQEVFKQCEKVCDGLTRSINDYAKRLSFPAHRIAGYQDVLCDYLGFLHPLLDDLRKLPFMPKGPVYLLVDDADFLSYTQTRVLNSWVATRTQEQVSIKISTQLRYKTFSTVFGMPIQTPHDYQEINIADIYTSRRSLYPKRIEDILTRRLRKANINVSPREFFPPDDKQEKAIKKIAQQLRKSFPEQGRGFRPSDDVTRYARPEYIRRLGGKAKQTSKYSYAGFEQLVHISSGLVRYFLEPAAQMFDEEFRVADASKQISFIRPSIQDDIVRQEAENLMFTEFDKIANDGEADNNQEEQARRPSDVNKANNLRNLIRALGGTFFQKLISDDAERRVFSVAVSGMPDREVVEVFELGVQYGYFHRSSIGNKDGTGRTRLYVLTRRLAPHFNLDPSSFAGYLWVTNDMLVEGMANPDRVLRRIKKSGVSELEVAKFPLFE